MELTDSFCYILHSNPPHSHLESPVHVLNQFHSQTNAHLIKSPLTVTRKQEIEWSRRTVT